VIAQYEAYQNALGIRTLSFHRPSVTLDESTGDVVMGHKNSPLLAVGSYDGNVRMLSTHSWNVAFVFPTTHPNMMMPGLANDIVTTVEVLETEETGLLKGLCLDDEETSLNDTMSSTFSTK
jgi:hypothetical protein